MYWKIARSAALMLLALVGGASVDAASRPATNDVLRLRAAAFTQRRDVWYLQCPASGPWVQYTFLAAKNLKPALKRQKLSETDVAQHVSDRYDIVFSGKPAYYYLAHGRQWLDFGNSLNVTYHATQSDGKWSYVLDEDDKAMCGIGETQRNPQQAAIPVLTEPLRVK